jgi:hypothetical protein
MKRGAGAGSAPRLAKFATITEPARDQRQPKLCFDEATAVAHHCHTWLKG